MKKAIKPQTIESWFTKAGVERQREIDAADKRLGVSFFPPDWRERLAARDKKNKTCQTKIPLESANKLIDAFSLFSPDND